MRYEELAKCYKKAQDPRELRPFNEAVEREPRAARRLHRWLLMTDLHCISASELLIHI